MSEPKIVEAVFTSANSGGLNKSPLAKMVELAMANAVKECYAAGIVEPEKVRHAMMAARAAVKKWYHEETAKMAELQAKKLAAEG